MTETRQFAAPGVYFKPGREPAPDQAGCLTGTGRAAALIEYIFSRGGLGQWGLNAILLGDFAVVQGYVLTLGLLSVLIFLVVEPRSGAIA